MAKTATTATAAVWTVDLHLLPNSWVCVCDTKLSGPLWLEIVELFAPTDTHVFIAYTEDGALAGGIFDHQVAAACTLWIAGQSPQ